MNLTYPLLTSLHLPSRITERSFCNNNLEKFNPVSTSLRQHLNIIANASANLGIVAGIIISVVVAEK